MTKAKKPSKKVTKVATAKDSSQELSDEQLERVAGGADERPAEAITFGYGSIQISYKT